MRYPFKCPKCGQYRKGFEFSRYKCTVQCQGCHVYLTNPLFERIFTTGRWAGKDEKAREIRSAMGTIRGY